MVSAVKSRANHYEVLGLKPTASDEEIKQAFATKMLSSHSMSELAEIGVAFDTLRDPAKRRAYDDSIGIGRKTARVSPTPQWTGGAFLIRAAAHPALDLQRRLEQPPKTPPQPEPAPEPKVAAIAASLRELAKPGVYDAPLIPAERAGSEQPVERTEPTKPKSHDRLEPVIEHILAVGRAEKERLRSSERRSPDWKRAAIAGGALLVGAGIFGTLAGLTVADNETPAQAEPGISATLPPARPKASSVVSPAMRPAPTAAAPLSSVVSEPVTRKHPVSRAKPVEDRLGDISQSLASPPEQSPSSAEASAEIPAATAVPASMPLSDAVIARTIGRVGYACGQVASTSAVEGEAAGVFKVTCTSGQSYRAAPVRGRYHFRRWSSR
jgi:hypothetical protein